MNHCLYYLSQIALKDTETKFSVISVAIIFALRFEVDTLIRILFPYFIKLIRTILNLLLRIIHEHTMCSGIKIYVTEFIDVFLMYFLRVQILK